MNWAFSSSGVPSAPFSVFRLDAFWAYEAPDGLLAVAGKLPWGQLPSFLTDLAYPRIHYTAFRGWSDDLWYDGPLFYVADGAVQSCVLPGSGAQLPTSTQNAAEGFAPWLVDREVLAWKKSLAWAFRERLALPHGAYILQNLQCSPLHILTLLGLRIAFPATQFYALEYPAELKPQWKRVCQNLNLSTWAAPAQLQGLTVLDVDDLSRFWPLAASTSFLLQLNQRIPFVPGKLLQSFSSSQNVSSS